MEEDKKPHKFRTINELGNWLEHEKSLSEGALRKRAQDKTHPITTNSFRERRAYLERGIALLDGVPRFRRYATYLRLRVNGCPDVVIAEHVGCKIAELRALQTEAVYTVQNLILQTSS